MRGGVFGVNFHDSPRISHFDKETSHCVTISIHRWDLRDHDQPVEISTRCDFGETGAGFSLLAEELSHNAMHACVRFAILAEHSSVSQRS